MFNIQHSFNIQFFNIQWVLKGKKIYTRGQLVIYNLCSRVLCNLLTIYNI